MTRLALCLLLLASGASAEQLSDDIEVVRDHQRGVTCYAFKRGYAGGISCIPDSQVAGQRQLGQVDEHPDYTPSPTQAPALWNDERYSL